MRNSSCISIEFKPVYILKPIELKRQNDPQLKRVRNDLHFIISNVKYCIRYTNCIVYNILFRDIHVHYMQNVSTQVQRRDKGLEITDSAVKTHGPSEF